MPGAAPASPTATADLPPVPVARRSGAGPGARFSHGRRLHVRPEPTRCRIATAQARSSPVEAFSVRFDQGNFDEFCYGRRNGEVFDVAEMTRRRVGVVLNVDGGNESFGGCTRVSRIGSQRDWNGHSRRCEGSARLGQACSTEADLTSIRNKAHGLPVQPRARYGRYVSWRGGCKRASLFTHDFGAHAEGSSAADVMSIPARFKVRGPQKRWILREGCAIDCLTKPSMGQSKPLQSLSGTGCGTS